MANRIGVLLPTRCASCSRGRNAKTYSPLKHGPVAQLDHYRCCGPVYGPPVIYVVPPAYAYYPRPLYRVGCCGTIYGPRGSYHTAYYSRYGYQGYRG